ncbi:piggyBac transposable element-derived protein 4 [Trichonephila clavipes]|nr:piggyBac transposable element-derived protein 4 [Trichonephila clavipes]
MVFRRKSVLTRIHELKGKGYCLSTDNFYTSPELLELLIGSKTDICGMMEVKAKKGNSVKLKPKAVVFYNNTMGGVDRPDQCLSNYPVAEINSENTT